MTKPLDDLAETHSCIVALLESRVISPATRSEVEQFRRKIEQEMAQSYGLEQSKSEEPPDEVAAG